MASQRCVQWGGLLWWAVCQDLIPVLVPVNAVSLILLTACGGDDLPFGSGLLLLWQQRSAVEGCWAKCAAFLFCGVPVVVFVLHPP
jgi:hypothetical protein